MSSLSLTEVCSGLPLDPLPPPRSRDPSLPHAPVRTPDLSPAEKKVICNYFRSKVVFMGRGYTSGRQESGLCLVQLCAKYRLVSATSSPYH